MSEKNTNVVFFNTYKLIKGSSVPDFLKTVDELFQENILKQKGIVEGKIMSDGDTWGDYAAFETMEDLNAFLEAAQAAQENGTNDIAAKFYSYINFSTCKSHMFTVEKTFLPK